MLPVVENPGLSVLNCQIVGQYPISVISNLFVCKKSRANEIKFHATRKNSIFGIKNVLFLYFCDGI